MNSSRNEMVDRLSKKGYQKGSSRAVITDVFRTITEMLMDGESVCIPNFGVFDIHIMKGHDVVQIDTGKPEYVPAMACPKFKASQTLKQMIRDHMQVDTAG